ncbi:GAF domain-containing protein [Microbacterium sp. 3J1]|uniref:GAF domain-containing protein n=1 Tax=Microbacterium sp. 3J1 TaxID=861269 RepID=UPI000B8097B8|nr:GAF domain-containing protein [Microbacterium sp. 3J1]
MRSRDDGVAPGVAVERALRRGICGVGGRVDAAPVSLEAALAAVDRRHGERMARRLERFAAVPEGAFVWTRDLDGLFWLGRLTGSWRYDGSSDALGCDLVHVRPCDWLADPMAPGRVPTGVLQSFARGGRNWQRIHAGDASPLSAAIWEGARGIG